MPVTKKQTQKPQPKPAKRPATEPTGPQTYLTHKKTGKVRRKVSVSQSDKAQFRPSTPREIALAGL